MIRLEVIKEAIDKAAKEAVKTADAEKTLWINKFKSELRQTAIQIQSFVQMTVLGKITPREAVQLTYQLAILQRGIALEQAAKTQEVLEVAIEDVAKDLTSSVISSLIIK